MKDWIVYCHTFADGKKYVGTTCNTYQRWQYGLGYRDNEKMFAHIQQDGWNSINHEVLVQGLETEEEARIIEGIMIAQLETYNSEFGYNHKRNLKTLEEHKDEIDSYKSKYNLAALNPRPLPNALKLIEEYRQHLHECEIREKYRDMAIWHVQHPVEAMCNPLPEYKDPEYLKVYREEAARIRAEQQQRERQKRYVPKKSAQDEVDAYMKERREKITLGYQKMTRQGD